MAIRTLGGREKQGLRRRSGALLLASVVAACAWAQQGPKEADASQQDDPLSQVGAPQAVAGAPSAEPGGFFNRFRLHAYADVDFSHNGSPGEPNHFNVGEIDLFGTMAIAPKVSALAEVVVDADGTTPPSSVPVNLERLLLQYRVNDHLKIEVGQFRTAIGYYSTAYLRGAWFQTAISRPRMFAFEEDGGILPLHTVGVSVSGEIPSGALGLHYIAEFGNAPTWGSPTPSSATGHNAINLALYARPRLVPGLQVGVADYHDRYSLFPGLNTNREGVSAYAVYTANRIEWLNEGVAARLCCGPANAGVSFDAFYSQLGYRVGRNWGPYFRVEKLALHSDVYFRGLMSGVAPWRSIYTGGVRYDWNDHVALKLELGHESDIGVPHYYQAAAQVAFAF
jgi:hypothetical protein